jgi:inorganic pyrophosphatase
MESKLQPGQTVYVKPIGNAARRSSVIEEAVVEAVGKKFFTLEKWTKKRFYIDTLIEDACQYTPNYKVYLTKQEIEDERLAANLRREAENGIKAYLTLDQLKRIKTILDE